MPKVFISYRRADSQWVVDAIYSQMRQILGAENIFLDVDDIPPGVDFRVFLHDEIAKADVVLVVMGPDWARILKERAKQANDFVRIEVENALQQGKLVIPVLVMEAEIPDFSELPESVQDLQWRNISRIRRHPDMEGDCVRLAKGISRAMNLADTPKPEPVVTTPKLPNSLNLMPQPFDWIEIKGGSGRLKTNQDDVTLAIPTQTYWIAKYPVTNAQFKVFMDAGGYKNDKWWTEQGWQKCQEGWHYDNGWKPSGTAWTEPRYWGDSKWNGAEQPVVGVSWFEAVAFCLWLSDATGEKIMLPTEAQWQYAA